VSTALAATAQRILTTLSSVEYLGAPPDLSMRLLAKAKDRKSSVEDIAGLIMCSPPVSASLLKLSNSAFYGRGEPIDSVLRAVVRLGLKTVVQFVYAMDMVGIFRGARAAPAFNETLFWKSSLAGALVAQEIAATCGIADADPVFLAALLRDIGVLLLRQYFPDLFSETLKRAAETRSSFDEACAAVCGIDHRSMAFLLAMRWKLPATLSVVFQPPALGVECYDRHVLTRNIVLYAEYSLKINSVYPWDPRAAADPAVGALAYIASDTVDAMLLKIIAEVNELYTHM